MNNAAWDFEGYWNAVFGATRTPRSIVEEFGLTDPPAIRDWIVASEREALAQYPVGGRCDGNDAKCPCGDLGLGFCGIERPASWDAHQERAFSKLVAVGDADAD